MKELKDFTTEELLNELLRREPTDSTFEMKTVTPTSYTFKFYRFD